MRGAIAEQTQVGVHNCYALSEASFFFDTCSIDSQCSSVRGSHLCSRSPLSRCCSFVPWATIIKQRVQNETVPPSKPGLRRNSCSAFSSMLVSPRGTNSWEYRITQVLLANNTFLSPKHKVHQVPIIYKRV